MTQECFRHDLMIQAISSARNIGLRWLQTERKKRVDDELEEDILLARKVNEGESRRNPLNVLIFSFLFFFNF